MHSEGRYGLERGLVGWWRLMDANEGVNDIIGTNDGTIVGGAYTTVSGRRCMAFDGVNDGVDIPHYSALNFGTGEFSISGWFYTSAVGLDSIVRKDNGTVEYGLRIVSSKLVFYTKNTSATYRESAANVTTGAWIHGAGIRSVDGSINVYFNGELSNGTLSDSGIKNIDSASDLSIGYNKQVMGGYFGPGNIADIRLYSRALSAAEVARLARVY